LAFGDQVFLQLSRTWDKHPPVHGSLNDKTILTTGAMKTEREKQQEESERIISEKTKEMMPILVGLKAHEATTILKNLEYWVGVKWPKPSFVEDVLIFTINVLAALDEGAYGIAPQICYVST
jgi:hypothetical protein